MKVIVEIELGNSEMMDEADVAQALANTAQGMKRFGLPLEGEERAIRDGNGNSVGHVRVEGDDIAACLCCAGGVPCYYHNPGRA